MPLTVSSQPVLVLRQLNLIANKRFGEMVCLKGQRIESVSLNEVAKAQKRVPTDEGLVKTAESIGISFGR